MALLDAKCTNCNATLQVNDAQDAAICEFCGSAFIVQKAVQNYQVSIQAQTVIVQNAQSDFEIRGSVLVKYHGSATEVVVPDGVLEIGNKAFQDCVGIQKVVLPEGLEKIGTSAFEKCRQLEEIKFPDSLNAIGEDCFEGCSSLTEIVLPAMVQWIPWGAFYDCTCLVRFEMKALDVKIQERDSYARSHGRFPSFGGCVNLSEVKISAFGPYYIHFQDTPFYANIERQRKQERQKLGVCQYCGCKFKFNGKCSNCNQKKDY